MLLQLNSNDLVDCFQAGEGRASDSMRAERPDMVPEEDVAQSEVQVWVNKAARLLVRVCSFLLHFALTLSG